MDTDYIYMNLLYVIHILYIYIYIYFLKELAHMIVGTASLKSVGQASRLETQAGADAAVFRENFFSICRRVKLENKLSAS